LLTSEVAVSSPKVALKKYPLPIWIRSRNSRMIFIEMDAEGREEEKKKVW
jgi:hypothetical protein